MSMMPAFSPGPWITHGALVGSPRKCTFDDLYEQCSFHIAEKMPSSVSVGSRPISLRMRSYSSALRPCSATSSGVMGELLGITVCSVTTGLVPAIHAFATVLQARRGCLARPGMTPDFLRRLRQVIDETGEQAATVGRTDRG